MTEIKESRITPNAFGLSKGRKYCLSMRWRITIGESALFVFVWFGGDKSRVSFASFD